MNFTIETLHKTRKVGFMRHEPTGDVAGYRIWRDGETCMETNDAADRALAEARCDELNRIFAGVTLDQYHAELAEHCGQG
jgi:hypothetical protein